MKEPVGLGVTSAMEATGPRLVPEEDCIKVFTEAVGRPAKQDAAHRVDR